MNSLSKIMLMIFFIISSIIGFMIKLPPYFRHIDKEMHSLFYFLAAAFLNILLSKREISIHALIFMLLFLFGVAIELAQSYSNRFFRVRIHGRFDIEDVEANLKGLLLFSAIWIIYYFFGLFNRKKNT